MAEKIDIQMVSDIKTAKSGNKYFTVDDMAQKTYVCFNPTLHSFCSVGGTIEADITQGKTADDSPRIEMIYVDGKAVVEVEKKTQRSFGKSDKELLQIKQLAEAQNRSIQAQTALNRAVDLAIACDSDMEDMPKDMDIIKQIAKEFYQLLQSLTLISEAQVIIKGAKDAQKQGDKKVEPSKEAETSQEISPDEVRQASAKHARVAHIRELAGGKHWKEVTLKSYIKNTLHTDATLEELSEENLITLQSTLEATIQ